MSETEKSIEDNDDVEDAILIDVTPEPETAKPPSRVRRGLLVGFTLMAVLAVFLSGAIFAPEIRSLIPRLATDAPAVPTPDPAALLDRIRQLETQIAALENAPEPQTADTDLSYLERQLENTASQMDQMRAQVQTLASQLADLRNRPASTSGNNDADITALTSELNTLRSRLSQIEASRPGAIESMQPMTIAAMARLRQAVEQGTGFAPALKGVEQLLIARGTVPVAAGDAFDLLSKSAQTGVPPITVLQQEFADIAGDMVAQDSLPEDADWWDRTVAAVSGAITIRETGELEGDSTEARVARAELALKAGDLNKALNDIKTITSRAADVAAPWVSRAQSRANAVAALDTLDAILLEGDLSS